MNKKQETAPVRFSACSHCFLPFMNFEQICGLLQQKGFDALEIIGEPARINGDSLKKIIQDSGLSVSCITASGRRGTNRDLSSPRHSIRSATVEHFQRCVDLAAQLECHTITVVPMEIGKFEPESSKHEELDWIAKGLRDIQQHAHQCGVNVTLEILNRRSAHSLNTVAEVVSFFANPLLSFSESAREKVAGRMISNHI